MKKIRKIECEGCGNVIDLDEAIIWGEAYICYWCYEEANDYFVSDDF